MVNFLRFHDILVDANNEDFITSLYKSPARKKIQCPLNNKRECPRRYKTGLIKT